MVAVHDPPVWIMPPEQVARIAAALPGDEVVAAPSADERRRALPSADILLANRLTEEEFSWATQLRWIHTSAVGVGGILRPSVAASPVVITNARGLHAHNIAEHAIALVLALRRGLHIAGARQLEQQWAQVEMAERRVLPLAETGLLVIGLGEIGSRVAALGVGLGMTVTGIRRRPARPAPPGVSNVLGPDRLRDALAAADVVVLAAPRTDETRALIGATELAVMRKTALLINVARGKLVDEEALADALRAGRIAGAGVDAFSSEPLPSDSLWWKMPNVLVTPHTAAFDGDYWTPVVDLFLENVRRFRRGDALINDVDKQRGY